MIIATIPPIAAIDVAPISIEYFIGAKNIIPHSTTNRIMFTRYLSSFFILVYC
jgi:hypothetical protein